MNKIFKNTETLNGMKPLWDANLRLLIWCAVVAAVFVTLVVYRIVLGNKNFITNWIKCKVMAEIGLDSDAACPEMAIPNSVTFAGTMTHFIIVPSMGTFSFLVSGTKPEIYRFWGSLARALARREWDVAWELVAVDEIAKRERNRRKSASTASRSTTPYPSWRVRTLRRALDNLPSILLIPFAYHTNEESITPSSPEEPTPDSTPSPPDMIYTSTPSSTSPLNHTPSDSPV
eukprot:Phypoly_transcript_10478.p1 GENE.Phypoly_transcript_10478~~Phypoly_transcript_10478.p1  ORF type:complete len:243 (+),score=44.30 Phypoly_transcript_10478:38-730(+)